MKPTYSNDRRAPRMRKGQFSKMVITRELFNKFKKEYPEHADMEWEIFFSNWLEIAAKVRHEAIYNPLGVKLGSYLGELKLQYIPYKMKIVDYTNTVLEGEEILHRNIEEKGKVPRIKWERRWAVKFNKILQFYAFDETREMKILAGKYKKEGNADKLRVARVTIGGHSIWRQKLKTNEHKTSSDRLPPQ